MFKNTSKYPTLIVEQLVDFAAAQVLSHCLQEKVGCYVKGGRHAYRGRAYNGVPSQSTFLKEVREMEAEAAALEEEFYWELTYHVVVAIGAAEKFPHNNMVRVREWQPIPSADCAAPNALKVEQQKGSGKWFQLMLIKEHPYGGYSSPLITYNDWKEAIVGVAAHEFQHICQFYGHLPASEVECEQTALRVLEAYRTELAAGRVSLAADPYFKQPQNQSFADWARELAKHGHSTAEIARITGKRYQQVRQALQGTRK